MICALRRRHWQPHRNDFHYRHIVYETASSTSGDLLCRSNDTLYAGHLAITVLREPFSRAVSEYSFLRDRPPFMERLNPQPNSLEEYLLHRQTSNGMVGFLLGRPLFDKRNIELTQTDLRHVLRMLGLDAENSSGDPNLAGSLEGDESEQRPLRWVVGVLEHLTESMAAFEKAAGGSLGLPSTGVSLPRKRATLHKQSLQATAEEKPGVAEQVCSFAFLYLNVYANTETLFIFTIVMADLIMLIIMECCSSFLNSSET